MSVSAGTAGRRGSTAVRVGAYALLAYAISWIWWLPLAFSHQIMRVGGWPTHLPGLLGPAVAAVVVTGMMIGRAGTRDLLARLIRWRIGWWWLVALSPLALLGLGWRGFLQPTLQRVLPPRLAVLVVAVVWAGWHAPLFAVLTTYRGFTPLTLIGFGIGLTCGAVVLGWLCNRTGSILAVAVWHATYNLTAATDAAHGVIAAVSTTAVIIAATGIIIADVATHGRVLAVAVGPGLSGGPLSTPVQVRPCPDGPATS